MLSLSSSSSQNREVNNMTPPSCSAYLKRHLIHWKECKWWSQETTANNTRLNYCLYGS